ncbi:hypothetical protein BOTBODRAFT_586296 [Botryobasidium botryosum FD-172 SS1]|uniref:Phospholipid-transporting ATPase n=1 Tax=Botryobasidium botryosum (strain FD-172 SS1) TaxID=930990 RepID=A0A067M851_BOTB1|nr:hypothetical protein BOTBODRAFT_586296 [Botryobasidium botryosum FD-172 SS1]
MPSFLRRHPHPDNLDDTDEDDVVDADLRLRTVRTASSTIAESIRAEARRLSRRKRKGGKGFFGRSTSKREGRQQEDAVAQSRPSTAETLKKEIPGRRRNIYVNLPIPLEEQRPNGDPLVRYVRNKVRTSKYTIITFIPKNLFEQFRRIANIYFLALVCIQVFPIFGAAAPQIAMLPLVFILAVTALKDGVEDYRRSTLDNEVNNSASTKLGDWRNYNQPKDPRTWLEKAMGIGGPGKVSKGVRKLREKEASSGTGMHLSKERVGTSTDGGSLHYGNSNNAPGRSLDDIRSVGSVEYAHGSMDHTYPPMAGAEGTTQFPVTDDISQIQMGRTSAYALSTRSGMPSGVVDYQRRTPGTARWERTLWKKLEVGDIVLLRDNDQIPADIVVLSTSDSDGVCYIETKNLDGETNLKPRRSVKATTTIVSEEDIEHAMFMLDSEPPHPNLYAYNGLLKYRTGEVEQVEPVTINELLLRGCAVRNTSWIIGLVVFTGADTKIMLNGGDTPSKRSKIERETNFNVIMNFIILILMCLVSAIISGWWESRDGTSADFFEQGSDPSSIVAVNALITFASCLIAFQNIVPVSLYISIEIVKTIQAYFINQDIDMYYAPYDTCCVPKTWNISDDLGQIEYVFSDKTGTLTQNIMEFQKCSVHGIAYGEGVTEAMRGAAKRTGKQAGMSPEEQTKYLTGLKDSMLQRMARSFKNRYLRADKLTLISPALAEHLGNTSSPERPHLISFFRALAVCHSVLSDKPEPQTQPFMLDYKAESPDEAALVAAARDVGFPFVGRTTSTVDIEVMGQAERYTPLRVLEFNSTRKRMSVIVRNPEGRIVLYCKGADSVIYARLDPNHDPELKAATNRDMEAFANGGLRTLCVAYRYLTDQEYFDWSRVYDAAASSIKDRDEELDKANEMVEHSLTILGATALEDKLQEGVPEAIEMLHRAGIKLWILTGDKVQTAIEIGFSCNLLKNDMEIMILSADSADAARTQIEAGINKMASILGPPTRQGPSKGPRPGFAVVIDGDTLRFALDPSLKPLFLNLGTQCDTVVCCRVSPAQKAMTVKLVKEGRGAMTLSIGDGANDVAMIQEANIGCGLIGLEGSQAAMSADYAFGQFRFLTKLLLVHGRWSYQRIADMHSNFFYKNVIWTFAMFWFLFFNSFDATYLYQYTFIILYNLAFTSLPVIVLGAFDQDINAKACLAYPQLYKRGILGLEYTRTQFWLFMFDGLYQSAIVYFIPYLVWTLSIPISSNGRAIESLADFGTTVSVAAICAANLFVGINIRYWTFITWIVIVGSTLLMLLWIAIYSAFPSVDFHNEVIILFSTVDFWAAVALSVILAIGPRYMFKYVGQAYFPLDKDIVREMWVAGDLKDRLGIRGKSRSASTSEVAGLGSPDPDPPFHPPGVERGYYVPTGTDSPHVSPPMGGDPIPRRASSKRAPPRVVSDLDLNRPGSSSKRPSSQQTASSQMHSQSAPPPPHPQTPASAGSYFSDATLPTPIFSSFPAVPSSPHTPIVPSASSPPQTPSRRASVARRASGKYHLPSSMGGEYEMQAHSRKSSGGSGVSPHEPRARNPLYLVASESSTTPNASFVTANDVPPWEARDDRSTIRAGNPGRIEQVYPDQYYDDNTPHAL